MQATIVLWKMVAHVLINRVKEEPETLFFFLLNFFFFIEKERKNSQQKLYKVHISIRTVKRMIWIYRPVIGTNWKQKKSSFKPRDVATGLLCTVCYWKKNHVSWKQRTPLQAPSNLHKCLYHDFFLFMGPKFLIKY